MQIPWLFPDFSQYSFFSLTFNKIPWLFPDFCQVWNFPDFSLTTGHPVDVFFDLRLNKRLSKHWWGWWFETPSCSLWRHCNEHTWLNLAHLIVIIIRICVLPYWGEIHKGQVVNEFIADSFLILWNFDIRICFIDIYHYINDDCLSGVSGVLFTTTGITHWGYGTSFGAMVLGQQWFRKWWRHQMETFSALLALCPRN